MAEIIGVIASVITVTQVLGASLKLARTYFKAAKELEKLQASVPPFSFPETNLEASRTACELLIERLVLEADLEKYSDLVKEVRDQALNAPEARMTAILLGSQHTIEKLDRIIQKKILRHENGTIRTSRHLWIRQKSKVLKLQSALRVQKEELLAAVSTSNLASSNRSEMVLQDVSRDTAVLKHASTSLDRRVKLMHQTILDANRAASLHTSAMMSILGSLQQNSFLASPATVEGISYPGFLVEAMGTGNALAIQDVRGDFTSSIVAQQKFEPAEDVSDKDEPNSSLYFWCTKPATSLELSKSFFPESYTSTTLVPKVIITSSCEKNSSALSRTNRYQILYFQSPRRWIYLNVSIEIPRSSIYWEMARVSKREFAKGRGMLFGSKVSIPGSLAKKLERELGEVDTMEENVHIEFTLSEGNALRSGNLQQAEQSSSQSTGILPSMPSEPCSRVILASLGDLGCRRYFEDEVIQVAPLETPERFVACVYGTLVEETKFCQPPRPFFLYTIQVLHCLRNVPGIVNLVGVTVDRAENYLKSYLTKLPDTRCDFLLHRASKHQPCSWQQIESWTRRLIEIIRDVHFEGYVVGTLWYLRTPVLVDSFDELHLCRFASKINVTILGARFLAPEFRQYRKLYDTALQETEYPRVTPKCDIFHLGMLLWILAEAWSSGDSALSVRERFYTALHDGNPLIDFVALPRLAETIPKYYRDVVDACRAESPFARPPAAELLARFPSKSSGNESDRESQDSEVKVMDAEAMQEYQGGHCCDRCGKHITSRYFHCNICDSGDFDVCATCLQAGRHCLAQDHLLVEVTAGENVPVASRYHSSVGSSGLRDVIED